MIVRQATIVDASDLTTLWIAMAHEKSGLIPDSEAWFDQEARGIEAGAILAVVACRDGEAVGFADGSLVYEPGTRETTLVGRHLFVAPSARGESLGERLMLRLLALGRQSGVSSMLVHGIHSQHAIEKFLGPMQDHATVKVVRW